MILGFLWFPYPITLVVVASLTAGWLYFNVLRQGRSGTSQAGFAIGGALVFIVPAFAQFIGTTLSCNADTGFKWRSRTPGEVVLALVGLGLVGLIGLLTASRPTRKGWLLPLAIVGVLFVGFVLETFVAVSASAGYCERDNPTVLYVQSALAAVFPFLILGSVLRIRREIGDPLAHEADHRAPAGPQGNEDSGEGRPQAW